MWIFLAIVSALCLGFYDISKKLSLRSNNVLMILMLNTLFCSLFMLPVLMGALIVFGERLNTLQWCGVVLGFASLFFISRIGVREGFSFRHSKWLWMAIGAAVMGAVSALYDKYLLRSYAPLEVQAWYSLYQLIIMGIVTALLLKSQRNPTPFRWRWSIPLISLFLTVADIAYFYALSLPGSMIAIVSMIRRGSVIVTFFYGVLMLKEHDVKAKMADLAILLAGLILLVIGSAAD